MIIDAAKSPERLNSQYDVCIVGAGAAGIVTALALSRKTKCRIALLDSGGMEYEATAQDLYRGETIGDRHPDMHRARFAGLGGSTQIWAGWCRPLDEHDFHHRSWVANSGWPIDRGCLDPYYKSATEWCGLGPRGFSDGEWDGLFDGETMAGENVVDRLFRVRRLRFKEAYRDDLERSENIDTFLHATVLKLTGESGSRVRVAEISVGDDGTYPLSAKIFVVASGGLENPRLLLLSGDNPEVSLGNEYGNVGRYFAEHGFADPGWLECTSARRLRQYFPVSHPDGKDFGNARHTLSLSVTEQERHELANATLFFYPGYEASNAFDSPATKAALEWWEVRKGRAVPDDLGSLLRSILKEPHQPVIAAARKFLVGESPRNRWRLRYYYETAPNRENRLELADEVDQFGRPRGKLLWRMSDDDLYSAFRTLELISENLETSGLGRLVLPKDPEDLRIRTESGKHPMGTTRMHSNPKLGVVNEDCRVHSVDNLYVAGSSVFPSVGYANPTLTIVALALRLADRLSSEIKRADMD